MGETGDYILYGDAHVYLNGRKAVAEAETRLRYILPATLKCMQTRKSTSTR
jgi:hypothetical protein